MDLITLQGWLDNCAFAVLFVTMLIYWVGVAFPSDSMVADFGDSGYGDRQPLYSSIVGSSVD